MDDSNIVDLDALMPKPTFIKLAGQQIEIKPPKTGQFLQLSKLGARMSEADKLSPEELDSLVEELTMALKRLVPELDAAELNTAQLFKLLGIVSDMAMPPDAKELKARGISADSPKETA